VQITGPDFVMNINNITYGGTTPEPETLVMFGSRIIGLAGMLRRKIDLVVDLCFV
jgi:hypothetical protein